MKTNDSSEGDREARPCLKDPECDFRRMHGSAASLADTQLLQGRKAPLPGGKESALFKMTVGNTGRFSGQGIFINHNHSL